MKKRQVKKTVTTKLSKQDIPFDNLEAKWLIDIIRNEKPYDTVCPMPYYILKQNDTNQIVTNTLLTDCTAETDQPTIVQAFTTWLIHTFSPFDKTVSETIHFHILYRNVTVKSPTNYQQMFEDDWLDMLANGMRKGNYVIPLFRTKQLAYEALDAWTERLQREVRSEVYDMLEDDTGKANDLIDNMHVRGIEVVPLQSLLVNLQHEYEDRTKKAKPE